MKEPVSCKDKNDYPSVLRQRIRINGRGMTEKWECEGPKVINQQYPSVPVNHPSSCSSSKPTCLLLRHPSIRSPSSMCLTSRFKEFHHLVLFFPLCPRSPLTPLLLNLTEKKQKIE